MMVVLGANINIKNICTMKIYEILSINRELLERLNSFGINTNDFKDVEIYSEYLKMKSLGHKVSYIVMALSDKFNICERKVYKIVSKMEKDCQICAVE